MREWCSRTEPRAVGDGRSPNDVDGSLRFSLGWSTSADEISFAVEVIAAVVAALGSSASAG